jgi:membrane protein insertase Oxa1/YidC/SpoIIIJ
MAEKMPSFKSGGAYWFVDLTTPDGLYIFPVLTALTFLLTVEVDTCSTQLGGYVFMLGYFLFFKKNNKNCLFLFYSVLIFII